MNVEFRPPENADIPSIIPMMEQLYKLDGKPLDTNRAKLALATLIEHPHYGRIWLIVRDHANVGYVVVTYGYSVELGGVYLDVDELLISAGHRRQGIGRTALAFAETYAKEHRIDFIVLEVSNSNDEARSFYRSLGFSETNELMMTKSIAK